MNADAQALLEQALRHVLDETAKLLKRDDLVDVRSIAIALNELAAETEKVRSQGLHRLKSITGLIKVAKKLEGECDVLSEKLWKYLPVSVSAIYDKIEAKLRSQEGKPGAASELTGEGVRTGGGFHTYPKTIRQLPIFDVTKASSEEKKVIADLEKLASQMLELRFRLSTTKTPQEKTSLERQVAATDVQIDRYVYNLYGLTPDEIQVVETAIKIRS